MAKTGPKRKFELEREQLDELYQRMSSRDIARQLGCGETVVWNRVKELGIKFKGNAENNGKRRKRQPRTEEHRRNIILGLKAIDRKGPNAPRWRGGRAAINLQLRASGAYKQWKYESRKRVNNRCEGCGIENGTTCKCCGTQVKLHCHHIKAFAEFPESRFDPLNSEVLCPKCHNFRHNGKLG